jgi:hypothetical protein
MLKMGDAEKALAENAELDWMGEGKALATKTLLAGVAENRERDRAIEEKHECILGYGCVQWRGKAISK